MLRLLRLAIDLDTGTFKSTTVPIILYVIRTACRFENYLSFLSSYASGTHETLSNKLREVTIPDYILESLEDGLISIRKILRNTMQSLLEHYVEECFIEMNKNAVKGGRVFARIKLGILGNFGFL